MSIAMEWYASLTASDGQIMYLPNDPATPELFIEVPNISLPSPCPDFTVVGWTGRSGVPGTPQFQASQVYCTMATAINMVQRIITNPLRHWSTTTKLVAYPRCGNTLNAYYDRASLRFFYSPDPKTKKIIFASESADIVSHELGHGILDSIRPDLWNTASMEIFAFHEAFGDILAASSAIEWPGVVDLLMEQTGGDMRQSSLVSRIAEELGAALFHQTDGASGHSDCLRNLVNDFKYADPDNLPPNFPVKHEPHSFSQIFSGAWYECLSVTYQFQLASGVARPVALRKARDIMLSALLDGVVNAVESHSYFQTVANSMLSSLAKSNDDSLTAALKFVLQSRGLMNAITTTLHLNDTEYIDPTVDGHKSHINLDIPIFGHKRIVVHLPKFTLGLQPMNDMTGSVHCLRLAHNAVKYIHSRNLIGQPEDNKMFAINEEGRLMRNFVCEGFCKGCL